MDDVVGTILPDREFHGGPREKNKSLCIVWIVFGTAVKCGSIEILIVGDQVDRRRNCRLRIAETASQNLCGEAPRSNGHFKPETGGLNGQPLRQGFSIGRDHEGHIATEPSQCPRQRASHIGQAAGLGKGYGLTGYKKNAHPLEFHDDKSGDPQLELPSIGLEQASCVHL